MVDEELEKAVFKRDLKNVRALLCAGANPNVKPKNPKPSSYGSTLLHSAYYVEIAKELLLHGAWVNSTNMYNETPLLTAIKCGWAVEAVRELLKHGADVNAENCKGYTPLNIAVKKKGNLEVIRELLTYGADINLRNRECPACENHNTPLDNAIRRGCAELLIKITLMNNFDKNYRKIINLDPYREFSYYSKLSSYLDNCICEITKMKTDCITNCLSLYEFITSNGGNNEELYVNEEGVKSISDRVFQVLTGTNYPIYHDVISAKFGFSLERTSLLNKLSELEVYSKSDASNQTQSIPGKTVVLDSYSKLEVAQYLFNIDLLNFTLAFYRNTDQHSRLKRSFTESSTQTDTRLHEASTSTYAKHARLV